MTIGHRHSSAAAVRRGRYRCEPRSVLDRLLAAPLAWYEHRRQRRHLLRLDDRLLRDIGLTRADIRREAGTTPWRA